MSFLIFLEQKLILCTKIEFSCVQKMCYFLVSLLFLYHVLIPVNAFWWSDEPSYRDPNSETNGNDIVSHNVMEYLASRKNDMIITDKKSKYYYKLYLFDKMTQHKAGIFWGEYSWTVGIWDTFGYCNQTTKQGLCLYYTDGESCSGSVLGYRTGKIEISCDLSGNDDILYDINEIDTCVYVGKLYLPQLCQMDGGLLSSGDESENVEESSYIGGGNIATIDGYLLSQSHGIVLNININENIKYVTIKLIGPIDCYFGVGFGSTKMKNTYAIVVTSKNIDGELEWFEQKLGNHNEGNRLTSSFDVVSNIISDDKRILELKRSLKTHLSIDDYFIFSTAKANIDIIWAVGQSNEFIPHIAFGEESNLKYTKTSINTLTNNQQSSKTIRKSIAHTDSNILHKIGHNKKTRINSIPPNQSNNSSTKSSKTSNHNWFVLLFIITIVIIFVYYWYKKYNNNGGISRGNASILKDSKAYGSLSEAEPLVTDI